MINRYLEDFAVGQVFKTGRKRVDKDEIFAFAREFDPQPFHLDENAAQQSPFAGLAASGWHTAAMTMRLLVDGEFNPAGGGYLALRWGGSLTGVFVALAVALCAFGLINAAAIAGGSWFDKPLRGVREELA